MRGVSRGGESDVAIVSTGARVKKRVRSVQLNHRTIDCDSGGIFTHTHITPDTRDTH